MASSIVSKATAAVKASMQDAKHAQLELSTQDVNKKGNLLTTDFGVKQSNTDDWLKVANEDKTGPMLLEDNFAREKVAS
jgi:catalase